MGKNKGNRCCKPCFLISILKAQIFASTNFSDFLKLWEFEIYEIVRNSARESLCQTFCSLFFYQEKTIKMLFTKAYLLQNLIYKNLFQIFCNLLDSRMFMLAKICALKAQVNPKPNQASKMEPFAKVVGHFWPFVIFA